MHHFPMKAKYYSQRTSKIPFFPSAQNLPGFSSAPETVSMGNVCVRVSRTRSFTHAFVSFILWSDSYLNALWVILLSSAVTQDLEGAVPVLRTFLNSDFKNLKLDYCKEMNE